MGLEGGVTRASVWGSGGECRSWRGNRRDSDSDRHGHGRRECSRGGEKDGVPQPPALDYGVPSPAPSTSASVAVSAYRGPQSPGEDRVSEIWKRLVNPLDPSASVSSAPHLPTPASQEAEPEQRNLAAPADHRRPVGAFLLQAVVAGVQGSGGSRRGAPRSSWGIWRS
ncbi:hypothetical protein GWK47_041525 [Chionoecetes opilio]|uniref:Uncharacterized protein n=1 Tax=Chionoecetes opilio TaxID=41210 RepID=A0A8J5CKC9_CHIOP|nr:hypothetical protein GWK47_041525 [Chionoecetes opilio]